MFQIVTLVQFWLTFTFLLPFSVPSKYPHQFLFFTKISICVCRMIGYPVHSCSSPLTVMPVMAVVLAAQIVELVLDGISFLTIQIHLRYNLDL
jgi:hypothetical protein